MGEELTRRDSIMRTHRYFDFLMAVFVSVLLISNAASSKIVLLGPFTFDGGTILFPITYILGDILTEVYGYARAHKVIWTGFVCTALMALVFAIVGMLPAAPGWDAQKAYMTILGATPRIVLGSLIAYFCGEFSNSYIMAKMKIGTQGRWLWTRTVASTLVAEAVDTMLFVLIAFYGLLPPGLLRSVIVSNYVFKVGFEALATPVTYAIANFLKRAENENHFDYDTDFNPFRLRW